MPNEASRKRRRVALACRTCRNRKTRCDANRPKCSLCAELDCDCIYQEAGIQSRPSHAANKDYVTQLERRVKDIEEFLHPMRENRSNASVISNAASASKETNPVVSDPLHPNQGELGEVDACENPIDGMGAINFTDEEDCGFFGPSSNIAFMRHISRAITRGNGPSPSPGTEPRPRPGGMMNVSRSRPSNDKAYENHRRHINIYALPSESRTWTLVRRYFLKTGQLLPFIHEQAFCETYFEMKRNNFTRIRRTWLGLLNIIMAIATSLAIDDDDEDMPAQKRIEESDVYYQRANGLCGREAVRSASLEMVQYFLILGQYLQGTQKSVQAWNTHGLAVTAAFQLGLHSPKANRSFSPLEREIRKRTWFGCVLLDRTLSMTFGRPCIIPEAYVKFDMPVQDLQIMGYNDNPGSGFQLNALFFTAAVKLYVIMYNVIDHSYGQNLGFADNDEDDSNQTNGALSIISQVLEGNRQLEDWILRVLPPLGLHVYQEPLSPEELNKIPSSAEAVIRQRFNIVLSLRYHNLRILLHRKFLERFLDYFGIGSHTSNNSVASQEKTILRQVGSGSVQKCVQSAMAIISTMHTISLSPAKWHRSILGAWNYSLYYTFNAGLCIFAALLIITKEPQPQADSSDTDTSPILHSVETSRPYLLMAADALRHLDPGNLVIERCVDYLMQLEVALERISSSGNSGSTGSGNGLGQRGPGPTTMAYGGAQNIGIPGNVELDEFMLDGTFDFLGQILNINGVSEYGQYPGSWTV